MPLRLCRLSRFLGQTHPGGIPISCLSAEPRIRAAAAAPVSDSWEDDDVAVGAGEGVLASFSSGAALLVSMGL